MLKTIGLKTPSASRKPSVSGHGHCHTQYKHPFVIFSQVLTKYFRAGPGEEEGGGGGLPVVAQGDVPPGGRGGSVHFMGGFFSKVYCEDMGVKARSAEPTARSA